MPAWGTRKVRAVHWVSDPRARQRPANPRGRIEREYEPEGNRCIPGDDRGRRPWRGACRLAMAIAGRGWTVRDPLTVSNDNEPDCVHALH